MADADELYHEKQWLGHCAVHALNNVCGQHLSRGVAGCGIFTIICFNKLTVYITTGSLWCAALPGAVGGLRGHVRTR